MNCVLWPTHSEPRTQACFSVQGPLERALRRHPLNDYRVISFATHAIVAGEIEGVTEPALVLSPAKNNFTPENDGLLTISKIANLTLDAKICHSFSL